MDNSVLQSILGSKTVSFHAIFAKAIGSVPAAVMLSQGLFWQEKAKHKDCVEINGECYFSKTAAEWYEETGITEEQQKTARAYLTKCGILNETRAGLPAKMHFRIDINTLVAVISRYLSGGDKVAVDNRSKKRELTRGSGGKFRQLEAVTNGHNIEEESFREFRELKERATAEKTAALIQDKEPFGPKKPKKEKPPQIAPDPPVDLTEQVSVHLDGKFQPFYIAVLLNGSWQDFLDYRWSQHKFRYKDVKSHAAGIRMFFKATGGNPNIGQDVVDQTRGGGWSGLFPIKKQQNNGINKQPTREERIARAIADGELIAAERQAERERRASSSAY